MFFSLLDFLCLLTSLACGFLGTYLLCLDLFPTFSLIPILSEVFTPIITKLLTPTSPSPPSSTSPTSNETSATISSPTAGLESSTEKKIEELEPLLPRLNKLENGTMLLSQAKALIALMNNPHFGLLLKPRLVQLKKKKVVEGSEIVSWMMSWIGFERREECVLLGEHLLHRALLFHVSSSETFVDSKDALYSFKEYKKESSLTMDQLGKYFPEERISDVVDVITQVTETKQTKRFTRVHDHCFHGADGVDVLMKLIPQIEKREEAVELGQYLLERGVFHHLNKFSPFRDSQNDFYQFYKPPEGVTRKKVLEQANNQIPVIEQQVWRDDHDWKLLLAGANKVKYSAGETVFSVGTTLSAFYRILTGTIRVTSPSDSSSILLGPRQVFGEMAAIGITQRTCASAVAEEDVELWVLETSAVNKIFSSDRTLAERFFKNMALSLSQVLIGKAIPGLAPVLAGSDSTDSSASLRGSSNSVNSLSSSMERDSASKASVMGGSASGSNDDLAIPNKKIGKEMIEELGGLGGLIGGTGISPAAFKLVSNPVANTNDSSSSSSSNSLSSPTRDSSRESIAGSDFLRQTLSLPNSEAILYEFPCKMKTKNKVMLLGNLYLSQNYLSFYASLFGLKTKKVIAIKSISTFEPVVTSHEIRLGVPNPNQGRTAKYIFDFNKDVFEEANKTLSTFLSVRLESSSSSSSTLSSSPPPPLSAFIHSSNSLTSSSSANFADFGEMEAAAEPLGDDAPVETLRASDWEKIIARATNVTFNKDDVIIAQDQVTINVYQIVRGSCRVERKNEEGEGKLLAVIKPGDTIGELNFLRGGGSAVAISADEDKTELYAIDGAKLHALFDTDQELAVRFYKYVCVVIISRLSLQSSTSSSTSSASTTTPPPSSGLTSSGSRS